MSDVIWEAQALPYALRVTRTDACTGELQVFDGQEIIFMETVSLAYGARFGPDVNDVAQWVEMAERVCAERDLRKVVP